MSESVTSGLATVRTVGALRLRIADWRARRESVALVPTMGALHDGHGSLIDAAKQIADRVVVSVFVNPTQFGPNEDFTAYPRDEGRDMTFIAARGGDLMFAPEAAEMYPDGFATSVHVAGLTEGLCGAHRPGHFDGVATVVTKLLTQVRPDSALFGEKDYQQLCVIRRLVRDLDLGVQVVGVPILREADGLALSSRNAYLSADERAVAPVLFHTLAEAAVHIHGGAEIGPVLIDAARHLTETGFRAVDYVACVDPETLQPLAKFDPLRGGRILAAAHLGRTRLIDNLAV
jgi:pantoate--beta-alanine ligase